MNLLLGGRWKASPTAEALVAFIKSLDLHGKDELSVGSGLLDVARAYLGDRPCCIWRVQDTKLEKSCERGMVDVFFDEGKEDHQAALARAIASGAPEFDSCKVSSIMPQLKNGFDGFLHIPIKTQGIVLAIFSLAVLKKEAQNVGFVQPLESLASIVGMVFQTKRDQEKMAERETHLKAEVKATTQELESTNNRLIERVKELKTLYKELQKRVKELTQANKAKNEFLSVVSHELRTPLTSLTGFVCVLLEEEAGAVNPQQKRFLTIIKQSADRLNVLISDLLDISRIESGRLNLHMCSFSLSELLQRSVVDLKASALAKSIELTLKGDDLPYEIWGDPSRIQQVVDNLISNAIKFTESGGKIDVLLENKGDAMKISVIDTGIGISADEREKVFDMFYQVDASTRRPTGGTGLGLAIARGIVALHGGEIWVESEMGKGSNFSFVIPRKKIPKAA